jgi:hypothetical protein
MGLKHPILKNRKKKGSVTARILRNKNVNVRRRYFGKKFK